MAGIGAVAAYKRLNSSLKEKVEGFASSAAGTKVTLREVSLSLTGAGTLKGLVVANPDGYKSESALRVDEIRLKVDPTSLITPTIVVHEVVLDSPLLTWELGASGGNLGRIHKSLGAGPSPYKGRGRSKKAAPAPAGRRVLVERFVVRNGRLRVAGAPGITGPVFMTLPDLRLKDLGKKDGGATTQQIVALALDAVIRSGLDTASGAGKTLSQALRNLFG